MLPSQFRLKLPPKWNRNFPDFKTSTKFFKVLAKQIEAGTTTRVGFIISTKVGKAVIRNRIRRKMENLLLPIVNQATNKWDLIFIVYPTCGQASDEEISTQLNYALSKIRFK